MLLLLLAGLDEYKAKEEWGRLKHHHFYQENLLKNQITNFPRVSLSSLFEISTGVLDDGSSYFYLNEQEEKIPVRMLRMGSFDLFTLRALKVQDKLIEADENLKKNRRTLKAKKEKNQKTSKAKNEENQKINKTKREEKQVSPEKLLSEEDYVICTRAVGEKPFTGLSLQNTQIGVNNNTSPYVISHHFIVLSPRKNTLHKLNIPFMHFLLDAMIEYRLPDQLKASGQQSTLTKRFLENEQILFPPNAIQQQVLANFQQLKADLAQARWVLERAEANFAHLITQ